MTSGVIWIGQIIPSASYFQFMAFAVNIIHGHGPSNKMHHQLKPDNTNILRNSVLAVDIVAKRILCRGH